MNGIYLRNTERENARLFYDNRYNDLSSGILSYDDFKYLGNEKLKKCRFCGKKEGEVTFEKKAHVFPECIGNKFLVSYYECDKCNKYFGDKIESEYSNCFSFYHSLYKIKGKKKVPVFQENGGKTRGEWMKNPDNGEEIYVLRDIKGEETVEIDSQNHTFIKRGKSEAYIPIAVFKCFVKMAISIMPENELKNFSSTINWIQERKHNNFFEGDRKLLCRYVQIAGWGNVVSQYTLFKRCDISDDPYMLFQLTYGGFSYLIEVPRNPSDVHLKTIEQIPFPPLYYGILDKGCYDFTGTEHISEERKMIFSFDNLDETAGRTKVKELFPDLDCTNFEKYM